MTWTSTTDLTKVSCRSNRLFSCSVVTKDSSCLHYVYMLDGSRYTGFIIIDHGKVVTLVEENQTIVDLPRSKIQSILRRKCGEISGRSVLDLAVSSHYLMGVNIATAKWFCNCSLSLRSADCVVKPRRCAASPAFYALSAALMKTDHFTKSLRGGYNFQLCQGEGYYQNGVLLFHQVRVWIY